MNRRTIITIAIAILAAAVIIGLWFWFFGTAGTAPQQQNTGSFGTGTTRTTGGATTATTPTNIPGRVGQTAGSGSRQVTGYRLSDGTTLTSQPTGGAQVTGYVLSDGSVVAADGAALPIGSVIPVSEVVVVDGGTASTPSADWLVGTTTGNTNISSGSGSIFTPAAINQLNNGQVGGTVNVLGTFGSPTGSGSTNPNSWLASAGIIAGTAAACAVGFFTTNTAGLATAAAADGVIDSTYAIGASAVAYPGVPSADEGARVQLAGLQLQIATLAPFIKVNTAAAVSSTVKNQFLDCLARTIAKAALQQITVSVVNWINSGFNGTPSFVTNYQQLFANVADQAAGAYIKNYTNFAPLCTPFRTQIQIALAQSYARRNNAPTCSLSTLTGVNVPLFLTTGKVSAPGWTGLLSFTTNPSNNPYGAYMSAQANLQSTLLQANQNANRNISPGGFLNFQQAYNCTNSSDNGGLVNGAILNQQYGQQCPSNCKCKTTTPGGIIEGSLSKTLGVSQDTLTQAGISGSFDAIISALITQLMTRALQGGVSNLSGTDGAASYYLTPDQQAAQGAGQTLLTQLQGLVLLAQQFGQSKQGSAEDIEQLQPLLNDLANCWQNAASSTSDTDKQATANTNATNARATLRSFDTQVAVLNTQITQANSTIAALQDMQTRTLNINSSADVTAIQNQLGALNASGGLVTQADLTTAQQDRTSLQAQLATLSQQTTTGLQQCNAFN